MRKHPNARVFGERTGGFIHFDNVTRFTLPKSGIRLGIPSKYNTYPDGKIYDKIGFEPDVDVTDGTDAFEVAKAWLDSGVGPALVRRMSRFVFASNIRTNLYNLKLHTQARHTANRNRCSARPTWVIGNVERGPAADRNQCCSDRRAPTPKPTTDTRADGAREAPKRYELEHEADNELPSRDREPAFLAWCLVLKGV